MKLTESRLRKIIHEEFSKLSEQDLFGGEKYLSEFRQYLSSVGKSVGPGNTSFEYKGYYFSFDPMSYALHIAVYRDKTDREEAVSATIEDDGVKFKAPATDVSGRPNITNAPYRSPNQVISKLIDIAES